VPHHQACCCSCFDAKLFLLLFAMHDEQGPGGVLTVPGWLLVFRW
jgi:hypothetical protein